MTAEEAADLLNDVAGWVAGPMTRGRCARLSTWLRDHPPALTPEFQSFLRVFLAAEAGGRRHDAQYAWLADAARFLLRVTHVCNEAGAREGLARLAAAADRTGEFQTLLLTIQRQHMRTPDTLPEAVPLCARVLDHPARLILLPDSHPQVLALVGNVLRATHLFAPRPVPGLHELRVRVATAALTPPPLDPGQSALLSDLMGHALSDRGEFTGAADDLRLAGAFYAEALSSTPDGAPERAERMNNVGAAHRDVHHLGAEPAELDRAIEWFEQAVALADDTLYANNLAVSLRDRYHRDRGPADLDRAVEMFERLTTATPGTDHHLPRVLADYSSTLRLRYELRQAVADLDRAVAAGERALAVGPRGAVRVQALTELGEVLATRAAARDDEAEFRRGVAMLEQARAVAEPGSRLRDLAVYKHALAHGPWLTAHETPENLARTVAVLRAALAELPASLPYRRELSRLLLMTEPGHARSSGDPGEMTRAIARLEAYEPDGDDEPPRPAEVRVMLADLYIDRGIAGSSPADLGTGVRLAGAADGPVLARGRTERFALTRDPDDLERALESLAHPDVLAQSRPYGWTLVVDRILDVAGRHPTLADGRDVVGTALGLVRGRLETQGPAGDVYAVLASHLFVRRYETGGDPDELRHATDVLEDRLARTPAGAPTRDSLLNLAGARWRERYTVSADPAHFSAAVRRLEEVLEGAEPDGSFHRIATGNLGTAYRARYNVTGDLAYLDEAVAAYERAVSGWDGDPQDRAIPVSNLANALRASYEATGDRDRLDRSIDLHERAVATYPAGHPGLPQRLINLAAAYAARFTAAEGRADGDRARELLCQALEGMPADSPMRPGALTSLATVAGLRFRFTEDPADLTEAVDHGRGAVRSALPGSYPGQRAAFQLARSLSECHTVRGDAAAGAEATALFRELCAPGTFAEVRRAAAEEWSRRAARRGAWAEAAEASRTATEVVADLAHLQVSRGLRNRVLGQNPDFGAFAAYALARDGDLEAAVMAVENARAVSLSEALRLGSADVAWLNGHGRTELARRYEAAAARWSALSAEGLDRDLGGGAPDVDVAGRDAAVRAARTELDDLVDEIRAVTGRDDFLRPPSFADVVAGAPEPLVYLVATEFGGVALIVADGVVRSLDLPALTSEQAVRWARALLPDGTLNWWARVERVARELGEAVLGPLTGELGGGPVTLIRSGYLETLPLNAAWTPAPDAPDQRRHAIDALTIRTAPNARVLAAAVARAGRAGESGVLAVHDPRPVSAPPLRRAAVEAAGVRAHFAAGAVLAGEEATPDAVLPLLRAHDVAHFACHGRADLLRPLDSSLLLARDTPLRLRDILGLRSGAGSRPLRLVVLSACETGAVGVHVPNEVVSLAGGLLEAGAAGVIASQWRVPDLSTALLMLRFYAEWKEGGLPPVEALPAAQRWLRDTTNKEKADHFAPGAPHGLPAGAARSLWRALVRLEPDRRGFAHPVHWAGFVFTGA